MSYKDIWINAYDKIYMDLIDRGVNPKKAERMAEDMADGAAKDRIADMIDDVRQRKKDGYYD